MTASSKSTPGPSLTGVVRPAPIVTPDAKFFWDAADRGEFVGQRCVDCCEFRFPPRPMCPKCGSLRTEVVVLSGHGSVYSWIRPRYPLPEGFAEPPIVVIVELEEGYRMVSNLYAIEFEKIVAGLPVEVFFVPTADEHQVPVFRPRTS
jgi:uncharacterized OB-fold protein